MSRHFILLSAIVCLISAVFLLIFSFSIGALAAVGLGFVAGYLLFRASAKQSGDSKTDKLTPGESTTEFFALGKLFEATLGGMREGLLVVDSDLRVVASNPAAHRLFNLTSGKLDSRRLTELTRNPAIYSAFLDALNGEERTGVKVETHDPGRRVLILELCR